MNTLTINANVIINVLDNWCNVIDNDNNNIAMPICEQEPRMGGNVEHSYRVS